MSKKRVIISVTNDLMVDHRVHKVATTLLNNNYEVLLIGTENKKSLPVSRNYDTKRFRMIFNKKFLFYAEYNIRLFFYLFSSPVDIFLANDTDTLTANFLASIIRKKKLVFDAHEMFPEVPEVVTRKFVHFFWTKIEDIIFPRLKNCYTVCKSIADEYNEKYNIQMKVIRNAPFSHKFLSPQKATLFNTEKKIILYQGAINIGRGIEWIIDAMPYVNDAVFYIIGNGDILEDLKRKVHKQNLQDKVFFLGRIAFDSLFEYTASSDMGICLLENRGKNYYYSLPNRIFDFIHAEVPILATDFPEIRAIITNYNTGELTSDYSPKELAEKINETLLLWESKPDSERKRIFNAAKVDLCWENESITLLNIFNSL